MSEPPRRGFILLPTYRNEAGRPVVHLWGKLESGESFLVRDGRSVPRLWIRVADAGRAAHLGTVPRAETGKVSLRGEPVARLEVPKPSDTPPLQDRLRAAAVECYEADVPFATRFLIDRGIRGSLEIRGASRPGRGVAHVFDDPDLAPCNWIPSLSILSIDIETDPRATRLLSVALSGCEVNEVLLMQPPGYPTLAGTLCFRTEREMLGALGRRVAEIDPDILTGWNVIDFDLAVLMRMSERLGVPLEIGRGPGGTRIHSPTGGRGLSRAIVPGRVVLDGLRLLRGAFVRMEAYSLDAVSREVLGRGKTIQGSHRAEEILRLFESDRERFVEYNLNDARLVLDILEKLHLVELAVERSRLTGMPLDRVSSSIAAFDFLYLSELGRRNVVAPTVGPRNEASEATTGGHVLEPEPGLYRNVVVLDFKSLYPSLIRTFQIDPLGHVRAPAPGDDLIVAPNGAAFRRERGILTGLLDELFPRREAAKRAGDKVASQAIKILMNSFYGVLGTPACRFHDPDLANAITGFGRELLLWSRSRIEERGLRVLYGDTDSLFVLSGEDEPERARELGRQLVIDLNDDLAAHVRKRWRVESRLELEYERLYLKLMLPPVRHGSAGARKRYAGLIDEDGDRRVVFTGLEVVRRDWTDLARAVQRELYERLFDDRPVEDYLREVVADLRSGQLDDLLVYRKALRKSLDSYTATTPPHVAAARKMKRRPGRLISYVMTASGPEPTEEIESALDHEHYVQKQVRPVAEPVLALLGLDFDRVVGDDRQLSLF
jgi:DNA polymerase-2